MVSDRGSIPRQALGHRAPCHTLQPPNMEWAGWFPARGQVGVARFDSGPVPMGETDTQTGGTERKFYFGSDISPDGCKCPAVSAGYQPHSLDATSPMANEFDAILREERGESFGTIPEDRAKEVWVQAVENIENEETVWHGEVESPTYDFSRADVVEAGREVAEELGWSDDE